jgi:hypothetical protein
LLVGIGQGGLGNSFSKTKMVEGFASGVETGGDIAQSFPPGQLLSATEMPNLALRIVSLDQTGKRLAIYQIEDLGEYVAASMAEYPQKTSLNVQMRGIHFGSQITHLDESTKTNHPLNRILVREFIFHHDFSITKKAIFQSIIQGNGVHCMERLASFERDIRRQVENCGAQAQGNVKKFMEKVSP